MRVLRDDPNFKRDVLDYRFMTKYQGSDSNVPIASTPLSELQRSYSAGSAALRYDGLLSEDVDDSAKAAFTVGRVAINAMFYLGAAATFTIADQLMMLFSPETPL